MKIKMKKLCIALLSASIAVGSGSCVFAGEGGSLLSGLINTAKDAWDDLSDDAKESVKEGVLAITGSEAVQNVVEKVTDQLPEELQSMAGSLISKYIGGGAGAESDFSNILGDVHEITRDEFIEGTGFDIPEDTDMSMTYLLATHDGGVCEYTVMISNDVQFIGIKIHTNIADLDQGINLITELSSESVELTDTEYLGYPAVYKNDAAYEDSCLAWFDEAESKLYSISMATTESQYADEETLAAAADTFFA